MNHRQIIERCLARVLGKLSDESLRTVFDFAEFLTLKEEQAVWTRPNPEVLAEIYADDEPEYTEADIKPWPDR